jgi:riboflavin kinase/FMN adenylyltransferase
MNIYRELKDIPIFEKAVVTIGSFDGVHVAHRKLIDRVNQIAHEVSGQSVVVTFHPHPRSIVFPNDKSLQLLSTIEEKITLFREYGVKHLIIVPFTVEFAQLSAGEYLQKFLIEKLQVKYLVVGYDHRFGVARMGDLKMLQMYAQEGGYQVIEVAKQEVEEMAISSTNIRKALQDGDLAMANALLGGYYLLMGKVVKGDGLGHTIGFPTANVQIDQNNKLLPSIGIYACFVNVGNRTFEGMVYIGPRPTINDQGRVVVEVNIFDFNENIYEEIIGIRLVKKTREDEKFDGLEALKNKLDQDYLTCRNVLATEVKNKKLEQAIATVSIVNFNGVDMLESYLPSVLRSSHRYTLHWQVIDNNSDDDSISYLEEWHPEVKVVQLHKNHGYAAGYNHGNKDIKTKYTILLNSDVRVTDGWVDEIIDLLESDQTIVAVQPKIRSIEEPESFEYAGAAGGYIDVLGYPYCRGRIFQTVEQDNGQYDDVTEVAWCSGAAMVVRTDLLLKFNGFDADFFAHQEEIDLCWRWRKAGYKCMVYPGSVVYHLGGGTLSYDSPKKLRFNFRNNLLTILKNERFPKVIFVFFLRLLLDGVAGIKYLLEGKSNLTMAIIRAHMGVYKRFLPTLYKRILLFEHNLKYNIGKSNNAGIGKFSIVYKYFIKKNQYFSEL